MKYSIAGLSLAGLFAICTTSVAAPLLFTYDCSIEGYAQDGLGTNRCAGGPVIAQVRISETVNVYPTPGGSSVLIVEARLQFYDPNPPTDLDPDGYQLDAVWLNIDELLLGSDSGNTAATGAGGIAWNDGPGNGNNDFNYIWFARDISFTTDKTKIEVAEESTTASSWKNFDLLLCGLKSNQGACALDLPVLALNQDPATQPWVTLGYLNSGNLYDLKPEDFNFLTTNTNDPGKVTYPPGCEAVVAEMASIIKIDPRATSTLFDATCFVKGGYGPRYGALEGDLPPQEIPEPGTLSLLGLAILGLGGMLHVSRRRQARVQMN